jgi:hypothetical protein
MSFGPDPFVKPINSKDPSEEFSAWTYAKQCRNLVSSHSEILCAKCGMAIAVRVSWTVGRWTIEFAQTEEVRFLGFMRRRKPVAPLCPLVS